MNEFKFNWSYVKKGAPYVTVSQFGLAFNQICIDFLGSPEEVMIGYDSDLVAIGVKAVERNKFKDSFPFIEKERLGWIRIGCKDFIKYISKITKIDFTEKSRKYIPDFIEEKGLIIIKLIEASPEEE